MAATILKSPRAVEVSVFVVRAFVKLRQMILTPKDLATKLADLERRVGGHDESIRQLVRKWLGIKQKLTRRIGTWAQAIRSNFTKPW